MTPDPISADVRVCTPCGCHVLFVNNNPNLCRLTSPCNKHRNLLPFDSIKLLHETGLKYAADPLQFRRL